MHELPLLVNIAVALGAALLGGVLARLVGVPAIVGYLLAGVAIGPFTPGFVGDVARVAEGSPFADRTLAEANLRVRTGASVVAIHRDGAVLPGPAPETRLHPGDRVGLIGKAEDVEAAGALVREGAAV